MIKLIITDLDGTLLDDRKEISQGFWEIEERLTAKGVYFAVASGRQYYNLLEKFTRIQDSLIFIAENGTFAKYRERELHVNALAPAAAAALIEHGRTVEGAGVILCGKHSAYVEDTNDAFLFETRKYFKRVAVVDDLTRVDDTALKVTLCDFKGAEEHGLVIFKPYENEFTVTVGGHLWLDITHRTANKGTAITKIQQEFAIAPEETLVFGDYLNDLEMMATTPNSYAMKNAHPDIIRAARYVTEADNNNDGVVETIAKLC